MRGLAWLRRHIDRGDLLVLAAFLLITLALFRDAWAAPRQRWVGLPGDPPLVMWFMRWMPYAIGEGLNPLFSRHINYPDGVNLMWNAATPLPALVMAPVTLALGPIVSFNVLSTFSVAGSAWSAYLMLRRYVKARAAAIVGGLLYGFSPFMIGHVTAGHPHMPLALTPPLMVLLLHEILVRQRRSAWTMGALLGAVAAAQLFTSAEILASEVVVATLALVILVVSYPRHVVSRVRHALHALGAAAGVGTALTAVPLAFQFFGPQRVNGGAIWGPEIFVNDLLAFVIPTSNQQLSPAWTQTITGRYSNACCPAEWDAYLGAPLLLLAVAATALLWSRGIVRLAGLLLAAIGVLSMGPHLHVDGLVTSLTLPAYIFQRIPLLENMFPARLMVHGYLMAAILVAVTFDVALRGSVTVRRFGAAAVAVALVPLVPTLRVPATTAVIPEFFTSSAVDRLATDEVVLVAPFARDTSTADAMLWQTYAGMRFRMPEGYALGPNAEGRYSFLPIPTLLSTTMGEIQGGRPPPDLDQKTRETLRRDLERYEVRSVIVGPMGARDRMVAFFVDLLGRPPEQVGGIDLWEEVGVRPATGAPS